MISSLGIDDDQPKKPRAPSKRMRGDQRILVEIEQGPISQFLSLYLFCGPIPLHRASAVLAFKGQGYSAVGKF